MSEAKKIKFLGEQLQQDATGHANNVAKLLRYLDASHTEGAVKAAVQALKLYFVDASEAHDLRPKRRKTEAGAAGEEGKADDVYREWVQRQYAAYVLRLKSLLVAKTAAGVQVAVLAALMEAVRGEELGVFGAALYREVLEAALTSAATHPEVYALLASKYLPCADVRFHTLKAVAALAARHAGAPQQPQQQPQQPPGSAGSSGQARDGNGAGGSEGAPAEGSSGRSGGDSAAVARSVLDVLGRVEGAFDEAEVVSWCGASEVGAVAAVGDHKGRKRRKKGGGQEEAEQGPGQVAWANGRQQRKAFGDAWLAFLRMPLPEDIFRRVLLRLPAGVIPHLPNPLLLSDFLTASLNQGGMTGMLALNGLFLLVTRHGLEYPAFYRRLYNLLTPDAFTSKHRADFFQLADIFLASGLVPAYTAASFAKRLARLSLTAPTAGALLAIAFIHNLLRRHPSCIVLMHRPLKEPAAGSDLPPQGPGTDPYDPQAEDPLESRAVESSLWELAALRRHHCPQVSAFVAVLDKDLSNRTKTSEVDLEPLLRNSYSSLFAAEAGRRLKSVPVAFYQQPPAKLFDASCLDAFAGWDVGQL